MFSHLYSFHQKPTIVKHANISFQLHWICLWISSSKAELNEMPSFLETVFPTITGALRMLSWRDKPYVSMDVGWEWLTLHSTKRCNYSCAGVQMSLPLPSLWKSSITRWTHLTISQSLAHCLCLQISIALLHRKPQTGSLTAESFFRRSLGIRSIWNSTQV